MTEQKKLDIDDRNILKGVFMFKMKDKSKYRDFYKKQKNDKVWWTKEIDIIGEFLFSFDKETIFNLFADYPDKLSPEQKEIFDKENPFWAEYFCE